MSNNVYLNGEFMPKEQAKVSVMDRGFLFGDGVYEVIPCYSGRPFRLVHHLERLESSLHCIRMQNPLDTEQWQAIFQQLLEQLPGQDQSIYLQVTRGVAAQRDHAIPDQITPTIFVMTSAATYPDPQQARIGVKAVTMEDNRWLRCNIKAVTLLANVLMRSEARDQQAAEAILLRDGLATEGAASNLFIVKHGLITTPPKSRYLLPGITRDLLLELAQRHAMPFQESDITEAMLLDADEVWLTSSTKEVMPVTQLNETPVANGQPGPIFLAMAKYYADYKLELQAGKAE